MVRPDVQTATDIADDDSARGPTADEPAGDSATSAAANTDPVESVEQRFWINTISLEHVGLGVADGFVQADHGKPTRLRWLRRGDWIVMYSPREGIRAGAAVQAFTALGVVTDDEPYQVRSGPDIEPWRRRVHWQPCVPIDVRPLLDGLTFVIDKVQWGYPFRRGLFRIDHTDFALIALAMTPDWRADGEQAGVTDGRLDARHAARGTA